jgi:hypothetical protein
MSADPAIWATWYDVDDNDRQSFLRWLYETYLPALAATPRYAWVAHYEEKDAPPQSLRADGTLSIGRSDEEVGGHRYITMIAAASVQPFLDPLFSTAESKVTKDAGRFLALRRGVRRSLFVELQRVVGSAPGAAEHPPLPGPAIQFGTFRMQTPEDDFDAAAFYEQNRLPELARSVHCVRTRKLISVAGWPKHGVLYEFVSVAGRNAHWDAQRRAKEAGDPRQAWGINERTLHTPGSPVVAVRTWPA